VSVEDDLRVLLREHAGTPAAAPQPDLLASVRTGVRRDRRRRAALAGGSAALALALAAAVPAVLAARDDRAVPLPPATPPASSAPSVDWVFPQWTTPAFPLRFGWTPPGIGPGEVMIMGANVVLRHENGVRVLEAEVGPMEPSWETEGEEDHAAEVNGRPATVRTAEEYDPSVPGESFVGVRWRTADGQWAQVLSFGELTESQVLRVAREMGPGRVPPPASTFRFAAVPPGLTLQHQSTGTTCLATPAEVARERQPFGLCVNEAEEPLDDDINADRITVGGRAANWYPEGGHLVVDLGGKRRLEVSWDPDALPLTRQEASRFAAGITVVS
jgi:hypothetical protein